MATPVRPAFTLQRAANFVRRSVHLGRPPMRDRAARWSAIAPFAPTGELLVPMALAAAELALALPLDDVANRAKRPDEAQWVRQWPGEHYRFLAGLVEVLQPHLVVEIGTYTGLSALTLLSSLPTGARVVTFDVVRWDQIPDSALRTSDFGASLTQHVGDLSNVDVFAEHRDLVRGADLLFIDGPKDRRFEPTFLSLLLPELAGSSAVLVIDDIRVLEMVDVWESIQHPKLDVTSFGHWSGTGLVSAR